MSEPTSDTPHPAPRRNIYDAHKLDRVDHRRKDRAWLEKRLAAPESRVVPVWHSRNLIGGNPDAGGPLGVFPPLADLRAHAASDDDFMLLGLIDGVAYFALNISRPTDPADPPSVVPDAEFVDLRTVGPLMDPEEGALCAYARGLAWWHSRHRFCGVCGGLTTVEQAGHVRACTNDECRAQHFPRTDPAVIMLVLDGDRCLLGRSSRFPAGMHSTLAGFVEPGESLERAVAREILEEAGIVVADVRYHSSQPWPFPQSLMLGFYARAVTTDLVIDPEELESGAWYHRRDLLALEDMPPEQAPIRLPRKDSIARRLIDDWLFERVLPYRDL